MKKIIAIVAAAAAIAGAAGAEALTLTVDEAVEMAVDRNLELMQAGISLRTAERAKDTAWNAFIPTIGASVGVSASHGIFDHDVTGTTSFSDPGNLGLEMGLSLSLPINMGLSPAIKKLQVDYQAGLLTYDMTRKGIEMQAQLQFYGLLTEKEDILIQQANIDLARKRLNQARDNYANGLVPELEVLSAEVAVSGLQPAYFSSLAAYEKDLMSFKTLLGLDLDAEVELNGDLDTDLYDLEAQALVSTYLSGRLDIQGLQRQIESLELSKRSTALNFNSPTLSLGYTWGMAGSNAEAMMGPTSPTTIGYMPIDSWSDWADQGSLSLSLQWKFDGFIPGSSTKVTLKEIQDGIDSMNLELEKAYQNAGMQITGLVYDLATARKTIEATTSGVELARRNYELTEEAYQVGTRELLDVDSAQTDYREASQQLLLAKFGYIANLLQLEFELNAPMEEFLK